MKWTRAIDKLTSDYRIHVYDDGSRDKTLEILQGLSKQNDRLVVHSKDNSGHGPTILTGYRDNADSAWVFPDRLANFGISVMNMIS